MTVDFYGNSGGKKSLDGHSSAKTLAEDKPWEVRIDNLYANVMYDEDDQLHKCWYSPFIVDRAASETPREQRESVPYRPRGREMGVCYATSRDGLAWVKSDLRLVEFQGSRANNLVVRGPHDAEVLRGDRESQTYAMPMFPYADLYLGLVMVFRPEPNRVHCELAWSADTVTWHGIDERSPLIPLSEKAGDYDWGCAYAAAYPVILDQEIRLYHGASNGTHNGWRDGFLALAQLRPDGWAGYVPRDNTQRATIVTQPVKCTGQTLHVTADVRTGGSVKVTVLDASGRKPTNSGALATSATHAAVLDVRQQRGQAVCLRFEVEKATLNAFAFGST